MMKTFSRSVGLALLSLGCGASYPAPTQHMADAQSAERGAQEIGAASDPEAQLHLKLADEQIASAKKLMADGDNRRADYVLLRAKADAELALSLAREKNAKTEAREAIDKAASLQQQNANKESVNKGGQQ